MDTGQAQLIFQLLLAVIFGGVIGLEREHKRKEAGLQTYSLVALGACLLAIILVSLFDIFEAKSSIIKFDPTTIISAVAIGVGFIGAGVIFRREDHTEGITTAAGLWTTAGIGVALGLKLYFLAFAATVFTLLIFIVYGEIERKFIKRG